MTCTDLDRGKADPITRPDDLDPKQNREALARAEVDGGGTEMA
jgi:hypothetical protein